MIEALARSGITSLANAKGLASLNPGICFLPHQGGDNAGITPSANRKRGGRL